MKICLINPPVEDFYITGVRRQPLGLLYIASALCHAGYTPELLNCHTPKKSVMELPAEFGYLKKYIDHPDEEIRFPFKHYSHYGMSWQEIESRIRNINADLYMVSSLFTTYYQESERIIEIIRKHSKNAVIAAGGYHPSLYPEYFLDKTGVDYVITGEGEVPSVALAEMIEKKGDPRRVPGLVYRESGKLVKNGPEMADVAKLKPPAREMLLDRDFRFYRKRSVSMIASRGCPNRCAFCTGKTIWGNSYRARGVNDIVDEIIYCHERYGTDIINFEDDNLFPAKKRAGDLLSAIIEMKDDSKYSIEFTAMNGISLESIDEEIIDLMKLAGFNELNISLVSQSSDIQNKCGRPFNSLKFSRVAGEAKKQGLNVRGYFIMGLPGQDMAEIHETINFMRSLQIAVFPSVFYNVYSPVNEWKMQRSSAFFNETHSLTRDDLLRSFNRCMNY